MSYILRIVNEEFGAVHNTCEQKDPKEQSKKQQPQDK